jgi:putative NIF3 family GTP cyclohydrolase 1 type 2
LQMVPVLRDPIRFVATDYLVSKRELINCALAVGLLCRPKLKVIKAVVSTVSIAMVNLLVRQERAPKMLLHHPSMFRNADAIAM